MSKWKHKLKEKDIVKKTAICEHCGPVDIQNKGTWRCGNAIREIRAVARGLALEYIDRPSNCEVCGNEGRICWDHDHSTGLFRGWLCASCNLSLGYAYDNPKTLRGLADYLEK